MALIIDASVAFKWYVPEVDSQIALALLDRPDELVAPELILIEVINAMWARLRGQDEFRKSIIDASGALPRALDSLHPLADLLPRSLELAIMLDHALYDCIYLALAERMNSKLITADARFFRKVENSSCAQFIAELSAAV